MTTATESGLSWPTLSLSGQRAISSLDNLVASFGVGINS